MTPVHSRPRFMRSNRGLSQYGGWLAASVRRLPEFDLVQHLTRRRRSKNPSSSRTIQTTPGRKEETTLKLPEAK